MNNERLEFLRINCRLDELSEVLSKDESAQTNLETSIITCIRWFGRGVHEDMDCDKFLFFVIALESLLIRTGEKGKTKKIAERSAHLIWGSSVKPRNIQDIKRLYKIRSKIVHEGIEDIEPEDLEFTLKIATVCLFNLVGKANEWNSVDALINEIASSKVKAP